MTTPTHSNFHALETALAMVRALAPLQTDVARRDADLGKQLRRAASSVALNLAEGNGRRGADRLHHFRIAAGSADETRTALRLAEAWGHIDAAASADALAYLDRVLAMLWRLTERRSPPRSAPTRAADR